ncbi:MAG: hypothetical protein LBD58_04410 [Treponema sp.]|nr:hypothetical protein [Treponema sp.]
MKINDFSKHIKISTLIDYIESLGMGLEITVLPKDNNAGREVLLKGPPANPFLQIRNIQRGNKSGGKIRLIFTKNHGVSAM